MPRLRTHHERRRRSSRAHVRVPPPHGGGRRGAAMTARRRGRRSRRALAVAVAAVGVMWVVVNKPVEGPTLLVLSRHHGVTAADLLSAAAFLIALALWVVPARGARDARGSTSVPAPPTTPFEHPRERTPRRPPASPECPSHDRARSGYPAPGAWPPPPPPPRPLSPPPVCPRTGEVHDDWPPMSPH